MANVNITKEEIDAFLKKNARSLYDPEYYFGLDTNQDPPEAYDKAELRILITFLSPGDNRGVSNTMAALNWLLHEKAGKRVFVDYCYYISEANKEVFDKNNIPYEFGCASHRPVRDFDLMILSSAICTECLNIPHLLKSLGIPYTIQEREKDMTLPPIVYGGAAANEQGIILGPVYDKQGNKLGNSLVDMCTYGYGEHLLSPLAEALLEYKSKGGNTKDKHALKEWLIDNNVMHDIIFYPDRYEWVYDEKDKFTIKEIKKLDPRLPDRVRYNQIRWNDFEGFPKKIFNVSGENADSHDVMISSGCSGSSSTCSFCMEATVAGYYKERPLPAVVESMKEVRGWAACNNLSHYSYNMNYYGRFGDLLVETARLFKHTSLRNERLDVVANAPDQLRLAKRMGLQRFSGAIEGMGDTIRNGLLNKNLPTETLIKAGRNIFELKLMHFKMGMIVTGDETKESMDEFIHEMDLLIEARDSLGAHTSFQQNFTPLVLYSMTPLRWRERKTAKASFLGERNMGYYIEAMQKRGVRTKFNGRGPGTWIEQLLMDFGPAGTDWMVGAAEKGLSYGRHFNDRNREQVLEALTERGYKPLFFCEERPDDWIFPNDHIIYVTDKLKEMWLDRWHKKNFRTPLCLRTLANKEGVKCHGCKQCQSAEEIKGMIARDLNDHSTPDDVMNAFSDNRHVESFQVVVKMRPGYDMWSKDTLSHYITSLFLRQGLEDVRDGDVNSPIANSFYGVGHNTYSWSSANGQKCWAGGVWVYDLELKDRGFYNDYVALIPKVNALLKTCQVVSITPDTKKMEVKRPDWCSYVIYTKEMTANYFKDKINGWDGRTRVAVKSMGGAIDIELQNIKEITIQNFSAVQSGNGMYLHAMLPCFTNPYLVVSGIVGKNYEWALANLQVQCIDHGKEIDGSCACGRHLTHSLVLGKAQRMCQVCVGRAFLKKITTK